MAVGVRQQHCSRINAGARSPAMSIPASLREMRPTEEVPWLRLTCHLLQEEPKVGELSMARVVNFNKYCFLVYCRAERACKPDGPRVFLTGLRSPCTHYTRRNNVNHRAPRLLCFQFPKVIYAST